MLIIFALAEGEPRGFMSHIDGVLVAETGALVQTMDLLIAYVRLNHHAPHLRQAEQVIHYRTEHLPAELCDRLFRRRDQDMHPVIVRARRIVFAHLILLCLITFHQENRLAVAEADNRRLRIVGGQLLIEGGDLFQRIVLHSPEAGVVLRHPAVDQRDVCGGHRPQGKFAGRTSALI